MHERTLVGEMVIFTMATFSTWQTLTMRFNKMNCLNDSQQKSPESWGHAVVDLVESTEVVEVEETLNNENANFQAKGFTLEDNNKPALEKIQTQINSYIECLYYQPI